MNSRQLASANKKLFRSGVRRGAGLVATVLATLLFLLSAAHAAAPTVKDRAGLFSAGAEADANQAIERIYLNTAPHKQVFVETLPSLPEGKQADQLAAERFREQSVDGVLLLIVKDPHKLALTVGRSTSDRFHDAESVRGAMLERFRHDDYDGGLKAGLRAVESGLTRAFPVGGGAPAAAHTRQAEPERSSGHSWLWLLLLGGGGLLAFLIWRSRRRGAGAGSQFGPPVGEYGPGPGAGPVGYAAPGGGGGGWARPLIGGAAGALAGNWLYDRFIRGDHDGEAHAATGGRHDSGLESDHGEVGSTLGGGGGGADWDSGGGDVGGDAADW